ncbi:hypothetical protein HY490_03135 [Candidatus Woesearchaeota archaeon]|nr:hypothetical protein [Candidatus Woesearchaeota archaeon]
MERGVLAVVILVAVVGTGLLLSDANTGLVPADQPVTGSPVVKECALLDPEYRNCATPNGGCDPGYPLFKQYSFNVEGIPTCCCVPHGSNYKGYRRGDSLYR